MNSFWQFDSEDSGEISPLLVGRQEEIEQLRRHFTGKGRTASISGSRGSGKTMLARAFTHQECSQLLFPGGVQLISAAVPFSFFNFRETRGDFVGLSDKALFILDDFDVRKRDLDGWFTHALRSQPLLNILFVGEEPYSVQGLSHLDLRLGGLTQEQFYDLIVHLAGRTDRHIAAKLWSVGAGSPMLANLAGMTVRDGILTLKRFFDGLHNFEYPGILGPDGRPIRGGTVPEQFRVEVSDTNAEILARLRSDPAAMRLLGSRKFEEIIADLLTQQGFSVELTPCSSDGGFDMYVAKKDGLGSFLYLVECKRYTPPNKVGVEIVRGLHGVVQQQQANAGVIVTSSFYTKGAQEFQRRIPHQLQLHDYIAIQKWLGII